MKTVQKMSYLTTKIVFKVTILVAVLTILGVWFFGLGKHRSIYDNSLVSTTILSVCLFLFLFIGLFKGVKLKDDIGKLTDRLTPSKIPDFSTATSGVDFISVGEGIGGIIISFVLWIIVSILIALFLWLFGAVLWTSIIVLIAVLYWIFFRAIRLVFKQSNKCKGNFKASIAYALFYTMLYNFWIYILIWGTKYLTN